MRDNPRDPYGKLLIITGDTSEDLVEAARLLTSNRQMPRAANVGISTVSVPASRPYGAPRWLDADKPSAIGTYTTDERLKLQGTGSINLYFRLPPDLFLRARQSVPLLLKYSYGGAPEGSSAALHVRLNGKDIDSIQLKPASAPVEESEIFRLPDRQPARIHEYAHRRLLLRAQSSAAERAIVIRDSSRFDPRSAWHSTFGRASPPGVVCGRGLSLHTLA